MGAVAGAAALVPLIDQMNPARDTLALSTIEVDLTPIVEGQVITVMWRKKPVFIRKRTKAEIEEAGKVDVSALPDPQEDSARVQKPEWLVLIGVCTHLGCVPVNNSGDYKGWLCPCHGSHYDTSGRIRKGPAPTNLPVPEYRFVSDTKIEIGVAPAPGQTKEEAA